MGMAARAVQARRRGRGWALSLLLVVLTAAGAARAEGLWTPLQLSILPDLQVFPETATVHGLRLSLPMGENPRVDGLDLGLVTTEADGVAIRVGGLCLTSDLSGGMALAGIAHSGSLTGLSVAGLCTVADRQAGASLAGIFSSIDRCDGLQLAGVVTIAKDSMRGIMVAGWSAAAGAAGGVQIAGGACLARSELAGGQISGLVNMAGHGGGLQIAGLVNVAERLEWGAQVGTLNVASDMSRGIQIGLVNVSPWHEGVQIGLINFNGAGVVPVLPILNVGRDAGSPPGPSEGSMPEVGKFAAGCVIIPVAAAGVAVVCVGAAVFGHAMDHAGAKIYHDWF